MIKLTFEHYSGIDVRSSEYSDLLERIHGLGHIKPFDALEMGRGNRFEGKTAIVDESFLFEDQFNTLPDENSEKGWRLFDWNEPSVFIGNKLSNYRHGYFISSGLGELNTARLKQFACGYCGKRYQEPTQTHCNACLGSEYLKKDDLWMLGLVPVLYAHNDASKMRKKLADKMPHVDWTEIEAQREQLQRERLKRKALKRIEDLKERRVQEDYKFSVEIALLENGIDVENLIYYPHTKEWCLGWREPLTEKQRTEWQNSLFKVANKIPTTPIGGIDLINLMSYKMAAV